MDGSGTPLSPLLSDQVFLFLALLVLVLLGLVTFFAIFTFFLRLRNEREERLWERLQAKWEPRLLDALSEPEKLNLLWESVGQGEHLHFLEFVLQYAQRLGGSERETLKKAAAPYLKEVRPNLKHRRVGVRARAAQTLGTLGLPEFLPDVTSAVDDPSPFVAALAARLLAQQATPEVARGFCRKLVRFKNFRNWYLVDMVVDMGPGAIPAIRETLADRSAPIQIRSVAAHSLSVLGDLESAELAGELAARESDPAFLASLMRLLAQVGTGKHAEAARAHVDSPEFFLRAAAVKTLSELGGQGDLPLLAEKVRDPSGWVRMAAARGIYRLGGKEALAALSRTDDSARPLFRQILAEEGGR